MQKILKSSPAFTLIEIIAVLVILGIVSVYALNKFSTGSVDSVVDTSVIKDVVRQTQMRAMADIPNAAWTIAVNGPNKTVLIQQSGSTKQSYTLNSYSGVFLISFDNMGKPTVTITSGALPFTIDSVTGFVQ